MKRSQLIRVINEQLGESGLEDDTFAEDLADRLEFEFEIINEEDDEDEAEEEF